MSKKGQNTQKGIFAQNWAALSLFLQFLRDQNFSYIQIEPNNSEDFDLVFSNGKKVICESKYRLEKFSYPQLKELLEKIAIRGSIDSRDEILVVCRNVSDNLTSLIKYISYPDFREKEKAKLLKHGFSEQLMDLMPQVNFWRLEKVEDNELNYSLIAELINFWVPENEIKRFTNNILQERISQKATAGSVYSRLDFNNDLSAFREEVQERSDFFNKKNSKIKQFTKLEDDVNSGKGVQWGEGSVSAFSTRWDLMSFAIDRLKARTDLDLKKWNDLWQLNRVYYFAFGIFHVFGNNLQTDKNRKYILNYIKKHTKTIRGFYRSDFFDVDVVKIVTKIINGTEGIKYLNDSFSIVKDLITFNEKKFFYLRDNGYDRDEWEKGEICKLLHQIYISANTTLKKKIFDLIVSGFNFTEDDGEFIHHAPTDVYGILNEWLDDDFRGRFKVIIKLASDQYQRYYKKFGSKIEFKGWEHMGGGISFSGSYMGSHYKISERHFVTSVLIPSINRFYESNPEIGWKFIKNNCISSEKKVTKNRPDFLNRSVYQIVLNRYGDNNLKISGEAFFILREFILSRRGIPHKTDLIYQSILGMPNLSDDKKWKLVEITISKYKIPVNPFAESIVLELAKKGHSKAIVALKDWFNSKKYYESFRYDRDSVSTIRGLLNTDTDLAINLFTALITSEKMKKGTGDNFSAYSVAALFNEMITEYYDKALPIIRIIESEDHLSDDQQIIYSFGLIHSHGNDESDKIDILLKLNSDIILPFLDKHNTTDKIVERLPFDNAREAFVQFAVRLAAHEKIEEALKIVKAFMEDPDPRLPGQDPKDKDDKYNEHFKITKGEEPGTIASVRGWCGWALMKCSILAGRDYMEEIVNLTEQLLNDENYYVIHMATFALHQIAVNRLTVLPDNREILFLNDDKEKALKLSKRIEALAFDLLDRFNRWPLPVKEAMAKSVIHVFDPIRALNEKDSLRLVEALSAFPTEVIEEAVPLFLYYAEFRKQAIKDWKFSNLGLYDDLQEDKYDDKKFKALLSKIIEDTQKKDPDKCFRFVSFLEHIVRESLPEEKEKYEKMFIDYCEKYFTRIYSHNIFSLMYNTINDNIRGKNFEQWYNLYLKCLGIENKFYKNVTSEPENQKNKKYQGMYWWPSFYNPQILEVIYTSSSPDKFIAATKLVFSFPKEFELHETDSLIEIIKRLPKNNKDIKNIKKYLRDKNPSKYWELK